MRGKQIATAAATILGLSMAPAVSATAFWPSTSKPRTSKSLSAFSVVQFPGVKASFIRIDDQLFDQDSAILSGFSGRPWTNGKLVYSFDSSVDFSKQLVFITSCQLWGAVAKVSCVARTTETVYVVVRSANENSASVGMPSAANSPGVINIFNWNQPYVVAHEIGHSLGLAHEHSRSDRDGFVTILTANIKAGAEKNFTKESTQSEGTTYDFDSVMHYSGTAFGKPGQNGQPSMTIQVKAPNQAKQNTIGQRTQLSASDAAGMAARYGSP